MHAAAPEPWTLRHLESAELRRRVLDAVSCLRPDYRLPLTTYALSHESVAEALGAPISTVQSFVTRARQRLEPF